MKTVLTLIVAAALVATAAPAWAGCGSCGPKGAEQALGIGVGHSELTDAAKAGEEAAKQAKDALKGKTADVVLVFDCVKDKQAMLDAVAKHFPAKKIFGCSAYNAITQTSPSGTVGVLALTGVHVDATISALEGKKNEHYVACGKRIGEALKPAVEKNKDHGQLMVLIGDAHYPINQQLVNGVCGVLGEKFPISGGAATGGLSYYEGKVHKKSNLGILISGDFTCSFAIKKAKTTKPMDVVDAAGDAFKKAVTGQKGKLQMVFAFDCGGRRGQMKDKRPLEVVRMKEAAGAVPIFGFYGSGETGRDGNDAPPKGVGYHICAAAIFAK